MRRRTRRKKRLEAAEPEGRSGGDEDEELWRMWDEMLKEISDFAEDG